MYFPSCIVNFHKNAEKCRGNASGNRQTEHAPTGAKVKKYKILLQSTGNAVSILSLIDNAIVNILLKLLRKYDFVTSAQDKSGFFHGTL
jgi:hypothetical protein